MLLVPPTTWANPNGQYLTTNMSFFLASFFVSQRCMQGLKFAKEPGRNATFCLIARLANMLLDIVALNWCKNVASETSWANVLNSILHYLKLHILIEQSQIYTIQLFLLL